MGNGTALFVVDVQQGLVDSPLCNGPTLIANIQDLIERARANDVKVVYLQHNGWPGTVFEPNTDAWNIHEAIAPRSDDVVIQKRTPDSFYATPLQMELDALQIRKLVVAGCKTEYCIDQTTRKAIALGYDVTLVSDAHSTLDSSVLPAEKIIEHYNHVLNYYGTRNHFVKVLATAQVEF